VQKYKIIFITQNKWIKFFWIALMHSKAGYQY